MEGSVVSFAKIHNKSAVLESAMKGMICITRLNSVLGKVLLKPRGTGDYEDEDYEYKVHSFS
jgi:hypothetical protein